MSVFVAGLAAGRGGFGPGAPGSAAVLPAKGFAEFDELGVGTDSSVTPSGAATIAGSRAGLYVSSLDGVEPFPMVDTGVGEAGIACPSSPLEAVPRFEPVRPRISEKISAPATTPAMT
jgi:hypothetical protein